MTMVEIVFALSLLTVLALAVASWTQVAARAAPNAWGPQQWRTAGEAALALIHDDIAAGDLDTNRDEPRVRIVDGALEIRTRASADGGLFGSVTSRYRHEPATGQLLLQQQSEDGKKSVRLLLDRVRQWDVSIDSKMRTLSVTIAAAEATVSRNFVLR